MTTNVDLNKKELTITLDKYNCNSGYCILIPLLVKKLNERIDCVTTKGYELEAEKYKSLLEDILFLEQEMKQIIN